MKIVSRKILICFLIVFIISPLFIKADSVGDTETFFVDSGYDRNDREEIETVLMLENSLAYFYIEEEWWDKLDSGRQEEIEDSLDKLSLSFKNEIHPSLTSNFRSEWKPGIKEKKKITVLFHWMKEGRAGYFREADEYPLLQSPSSNEREMVYLNADYLRDDLIDSYLAHGFSHLITFNQKVKENNVFEETWLDEARAEFSPALVGYDSNYSGSNLEKRVTLFLKNPSDSITEWKGKSTDYGALNLFTQYLVDRYGVEILVDSLQSDKIGISSIDFALEENGINKDFSQIFQEWTLTVLLNNCSFGEEYCYSNENLKNLRVSPSLNFFPLASKSSLKIEDYIKDWSGRWYKLMGGRGDLEVVFEGIEGVDYRIFYVVCDNNSECSINKLELGNGNGIIKVDDFGENYNSITLVISTGEKTEGFGRSEISYPFSFEATTIEKENGDEEIVQEFLTQINHLDSDISGLKREVQNVEEVSSGKIQEFLAMIDNFQAQINDLEERIENNEEIEGEVAQELLTKVNSLQFEINELEEGVLELRDEENDPEQDEEEKVSIISIFLGTINDSRVSLVRSFFSEQKLIVYLMLKYLFI